MKTQQNSKCRLPCVRDETIYHIISECSILALKEYKTRPECVGKVIHWKQCKKCKFKHMNKWYIHHRKVSPSEWDVHNSLGFWEIYWAPNLSQTTRSKDSQQKMRTFPMADVNVLTDHRVKLKKYGTWNVGDTHCNWHKSYSHQIITNETGGLRNKRTRADRPNDNIIKIGKNTHKCPGDFRRLTETQSVGKHHRLLLVLKTQK